ncbi:MAG: hypothetical protein IKJ08_09130, partial [Alistipes sp.]|nr:hypothetical protein [Alistipes sp.]
LKHIPEECRTESVCAYAVKKSWRNIYAVPTHIMTREMALKVVQNCAGDLDILSAIPAHIWDNELAIEAMVSLIGNVHRIGDYTNAIMRVEIVLGYLPASLKTQELFTAMLQREALDVLCVDRATPTKFKNKLYYQYLAKRDLSMVPHKYISYEVLYAAVFSEHNNKVHNEYVLGHYLHLLDDRLADQLVRRYAYVFKTLPDKFRTAKRLVLAIDNSSRDSYTLINTEDSKDSRLLTVEVCKAFVRRGGSCPTFPQKVWTRKFVEYCEENCKSYQWFEQMPTVFQTPKNTQAAFDYNSYNIRYFLKRFITPAMAKSVYRENYYNCWVPKHFISEFVKQTGLSEKFYGGERSLLTLKNNHEDYTYCKIGNTYIGFYYTDKYNPNTARLIMTRAESRYCKPSRVFECGVSTFHRTWLEKIVAENDPLFEKPKVDKSLRAVQALGYYGVEKIKDIKRTEIFRNTFLGETIGYCARRRDLTYHSDNCATLLEGMLYKIKGMAVPDDLGEEPVSYTADELHKKFGFCYAGMTAFAEDYNLDMSQAYTVQQMRQIVREIGPKPSLTNYKRELKKIKVI